MSFSKSLSEMASRAGAAWTARHEALRLRFPLLLRLQDKPHALTIAAVGVVHLALIAMLVIGLAPPLQKAGAELVMLVGPGGTYAPKERMPTPPRLEDPQAPDVPPPDIVVDSDAMNANAIAAQGSPDVTVPAEAIAEAHAFPVLPRSAQAVTPAPVRLLLSVTEQGMVGAAQVLGSSGSKALDRIAIEWVKARWRYRPARKNGTPVAVTTTAIVVFANG